MKHVNVELNQTPAAVDMDTGKPALPVVSTFRNMFEIKEAVIEKRPSMGAKKEKQVNGFLKRATSLIAKYEIVQQDHIKRGHKALYECMAHTYDYALDVFNSPLKAEILDAMRRNMKSTTGKMPSAKTPDMTLIVKYVVGDTDRQLAHVYSRGLRVAYEEDVPVTSLVQYIEDAGGISKITGTKADKAKNESHQKEIAERAEFLRRWYVARGCHATSPAFLFNEPILQWDAKTAKSKKKNEKESAGETGDFVIFLGVWDKSADKYRAIEGNDFGATYEMSMFRHMAARIKTDVAAMKKKVQAAERAVWGECLEERKARYEKEAIEAQEKAAKQNEEKLAKMRNYGKEAEKSAEPA